jgi:glycosyltransferase involved in cell wall biosynthesis
LIPGHKGELFCLAAEEARELCIPIVTLGLGSLSERVIHGKTGFIAKDNHQFAKYTLDILEDHNTWKELRNNLIKMRGLKKWNRVAISLLNQI